MSGFNAVVINAPACSVNECNVCIAFHQEKPHVSHALDQSFSLQIMTSNSYALEIGEEWCNFSSAFGAWLLSVGVAALEEIIGSGSEVISVSATFP